MTLYLGACACGLVAVYAAAATPLDSYFLIGVAGLVGVWGLWRLEFKQDTSSKEQGTSSK